MKSKYLSLTFILLPFTVGGLILFQYLSLFKELFGTVFSIIQVVLISIAIYSSSYLMNIVFDQEKRPLTHKYSFWIFSVLISLIPFASKVQGGYSLKAILLAVVFIPPILRPGMHHQFQVKNISKVFFIIALIFSLLLIGLNIFYLPLGNNISFLILSLIIALVLFINFIFFLVFTILYFLKKQPGKRVLILLSLMILSLIIVLLPTEEWDVKHFFKKNRVLMEEVVTKIENGEIECPQRSCGIRLPEKYKQCTRGYNGFIKVSHARNDYKVMFITVCGLLDNADGIVYSKNNQKPTGSDFGLNNRPAQRLEPHWYYFGGTGADCTEDDNSEEKYD